MIGFYDYTVILTYVSLASSVIGMTQAIHGRFKAAVVLLAFSGLCDMFDGKIAGPKRTGPRTQRPLESRLILSATWCASARFPR